MEKFFIYVLYFLFFLCLIFHVYKTSKFLLIFQNFIETSKFAALPVEDDVGSGKEDSD